MRAWARVFNAMLATLALALAVSSKCAYFWLFLASSRNGCNQLPPTLPVHASATLWGHSDMWWARKQLAKALLE